MPCLSSSAASFLKESVSVSKAESQLALPFRITAVFGVSVISSPNGSAVCTAGGVTGAAAAGGVGAGVAGAGAVGAGVSGAVVGGLAGVVVGGDCAKAAETPAVTITTAKRVRKQVKRIIRGRSPEGRRHANTRSPLSSHDRCVMAAFRVRTWPTLCSGQSAVLRHITRHHECARKPQFQQDERYRQRDRGGRSARFSRGRQRGRCARGGIKRALRPTDGAAAAAAEWYRGLHPYLQ